MQKIEFDKSQIEQFHALINGSEIIRKDLFISPLKGLEDLRSSKYKCGQFEYSFLSCMIRHYDKIIRMDPKRIQFWIKRIDGCCHDKFHFKEKNESGNIVFKQTTFGKRLNKALGYEKLQRDILKKFFHRNQTKTCYYCNSQYTLSFKKDNAESLKFQIDHIFPQKKYPYFSISLYNLIPSCANCNLNKSDKDCWIDDYSHPYLESIGDRFKFTLSRDSDKIVYSKISDVDMEDFSISITNTLDKKVKNHNELFDIEGIHSNFNEIVKEIITLGSAYPEANRSSLLNSLKGKQGDLMFSNKETIDRVFLRVYPKKSKINERPMSKLIQDISRFSDFYDDK